jgi:hypothetical protein
MKRSYGNLIPKLEYNGVSISDITHRFVMSEGLTKYKDSYYKMQIQQDQTPEVVSYVLYGTSDYWWVICAINNIIDPFYDWVMRETEVYAYAEKLYDDINGIHHYEDEEFKVYENNNAEQTLEPITNLEWEIYKNDKKLRINTIKPEHINLVFKELRDRLKLVPVQIQG